MVQENLVRSVRAARQPLAHLDREPAALRHVERPYALPSFPAVIADEAEQSACDPDYAEDGRPQERDGARLNQLRGLPVFP